MTRRDISLTLALCASLVVHALLLGSMAEVYSLGTGSHIWLPGFPRQPVLTALLIPSSESEDPWNRLGDSSGTGDSTDSSPGELPMIARQGLQNQAFLSLDPEGPGRVGDDPTDSVLPLGQGAAAAAATPAPPAPAPTTEQPAPFGLTSTSGDFALPKLLKRQPNAGPSGEASGEAAAATPGAPVAADPAAQGESESDPVSTIGAADFRRGATKVQLGRGHKITRPHLSIAAQADLFQLTNPLLVLKIKTDATGKVTSAEVYRSSGSNSVDQPCKLAAYNWWFEPPKDKDGKPKPDVILFAIRFI